MRNRFGVPLGRAMVLTERISQPNFDFNFESDVCHDYNEERDRKLWSSHKKSPKNIQQLLIDSLPQQTRIYVCDEHEVRCFVEQ